MWTVIVGDTNLIAVSQRFVDCPASFGYIGWRWCTKRVRDTLPCIRLFWRFCRWTCWAPTDRFVLRTLISYLLLLSSHRAILVSALINKLSNTYRRLLFCVRCVVWFDILPISSYSDTCIFISYILWTFCGIVIDYCSVFPLTLYCAKPDLLPRGALFFLVYMCCQG